MQKGSQGHLEGSKKRRYDQITKENKKNEKPKGGQQGDLQKKRFFENPKTGKESKKPEEEYKEYIAKTASEQLMVQQVIF